MCGMRIRRTRDKGHSRAFAPPRSSMPVEIVPHSLVRAETTRFPPTPPRKPSRTAICCSFGSTADPRIPSAYRADVEKFRARAPKPFGRVTLADLQAFADSLESREPATRCRCLSSLKSLLAFGRGSAACRSPQPGGKDPARSGFATGMEK
jgi:hypothetical protein